MRTPMVVLAILMLGLPCTPLAQQWETVPAARAGERAATGNEGDASGPVARESAPPRSLMGMAMAILIESAERSGRQPKEPVKPAEDRAPVPADPAGNQGAAAEQVAVQTVP